MQMKRADASADLADLGQHHARFRNRPPPGRHSLRHSPSGAGAEMPRVGVRPQVQVGSVAAGAKALDNHVGLAREADRLVLLIDMQDRTVGGGREQRAVRGRLGLAGKVEVPAIGPRPTMAVGIGHRIGLDDEPRLARRKRQVDHEIGRAHLRDLVGGGVPDELAALELADPAAAIEGADLVGHRIAEIALLRAELRPAGEDEPDHHVGADLRMPINHAARELAKFPDTVRRRGLGRRGHAEPAGAAAGLGVFVIDRRCRGVPGEAKEPCPEDSAAQQCGAPARLNSHASPPVGDNMHGSVAANKAEVCPRGYPKMSLPGLTGQSSIRRPVVTGSPGQAGR